MGYTSEIEAEARARSDAQAERARQQSARLNGAGSHRGNAGGGRKVTMAQANKDKAAKAVSHLMEAHAHCTDLGELGMAQKASEMAQELRHRYELHDADLPDVAGQQNTATRLAAKARKAATTRYGHS